MKRIPKVFVIILNWNGAEDTIKCVNSFLQLQYPNYGIVVIDNGSTDNSTQRIKEKFPDITLIETGKNLGYAGGNNVGIRYALKNGAAYNLIINNDTEMVKPNFLQQMVRAMEADQTIGIMGPRVLNPGSQVQDTILFTPTLLNLIRESMLFNTRSKNRGNYNISQQVEAVSGVCWLIKRKAIEDIGLLDEDYFMYAEEQDYCYRAQKAGWKIMYFPVKSVLHYKGIDDENIERTHRQYIYARQNLVLFLRKHFGFLQALILAALFLMSNISKVTFSKLTGKEKNFYNMSVLSALFYEFKFVLSGKWKKANKDSL